MPIPSRDEQEAAARMTAMCEHTPDQQGVCSQCGGLRGDDGTYEPPLSRPLAYLCSVCFAVPGAECNKPGWFGSIDAGAHVRTPLENACAWCRGSGKLVTAIGDFCECKRCHGKRVEPATVCEHCGDDRHEGAACPITYPGAKR